MISGLARVIGPPSAIWRRRTPRGWRGVIFAGRGGLRSVSSCSTGHRPGPCRANNPSLHKGLHDLQSFRPHPGDGSIHQRRETSSQPAVLIQQGDHISDSLGVGFVGVELVAELNTIASSLLLSSASRAFSFLICSVSLSICADSLLNYFVRSREALICFSMSGLCRQLSVCKNKRHRGKDEPHAPLLLELEVDACWEGDVDIGAEQGNQGNHKAGMGLDDSLTIKPRAALGRIRDFRRVWRRFDWWNDLLQNRRPNRA